MSERKKIAQRAGTVGLFTLISRVFGLVRDMAIAYAFGTLASADAFFVAFRIPNLLRRLFAEGALTVSFVPVFTQYLVRLAPGKAGSLGSNGGENPDSPPPYPPIGVTSPHFAEKLQPENLKGSRSEAKRVVDVTFTIQALVLIGVSVLGILLAPLLVKLTAWGFSADPEKFGLTVFLTRVMFPYILLVSLAAWAMGILNSCKHFGAPAAAPIFMNLGIILGALLLTRHFDPPVLGLAVGVLIGGGVQLAIHFPFLARLGFWPRLTWDPSHPAVKKILGMMVPAAYGAAVYQFNVITITFLASFLPTGSVSYLWYADRVMEFPLGVFAISLATVILPTLSDHAAEKNLRALKETFGFALRMIFFVTIPAAGGLMILSDEIVQALFRHGRFGEASATATSWALVWFAAGLPFISGVRVTSNAFYSLQDSRSPVRAANGSVIANVILSLILMGPLKHLGLAIAVSAASLVNFALQIADLRKKIGALGLKKILLGTGRTVLATLAMVAALWAFRRYAPLWPGSESRVLVVARLLIHVFAGVAVYAGVGFAMRMEEFRGLVEAIKRRGWAKTPPPTLDAGDAGI